MTHPAEEHLIEHVLAGADEPPPAELVAHLQTCGRCRNDVEELRRVLRATAADAVPARGPEYGAQVWARLEPRLPRAARARRAGSSFCVACAKAPGSVAVASRPAQAIVFSASESTSAGNASEAVVAAVVALP